MPFVSLFVVFYDFTILEFLHDGRRQLPLPLVRRGE